MKACVQLENWMMLRTVGFGSGEGTSCMYISKFSCIRLEMIHLITLNEESCNMKILVLLSLIKGSSANYHPGIEMRAEVILCLVNGSLL